MDKRELVSGVVVSPAAFFATLASPLSHDAGLAAFVFPMRARAKG
jgi:hypothetical protein